MLWQSFELLVLFIQRVILYAAYYALLPILRKRSKVEWVIGVEDIAANVHNISRGLGNTISVCLFDSAFYQHKYDYTLPKYLLRNRWLKFIVVFYGPLLLAYLCHRAHGFFYVGGYGFLVNRSDGRNFEFSFLRSRGFRIACFFCGSEIRSHKLTSQLSASLGRDVITTYQDVAVKSIDSAESERLRERLAESADEYADFVFNAPVDQISYMKRETLPFIYFYPEERFRKKGNAFFNQDDITIVHAPSSPLIKGTPLVRAAIKKLNEEGYKFVYTELIGVKNSEVILALERAHVVLNEFYAFTPGLFGIEAMAAHCCLLTSADSRIETCLPPGANQAWYVTEYWNIYDNLKAVLDNRSLIKEYADSGYNWALKNYSYENSSKMMRSLMGQSK